MNASQLCELREHLLSLRQSAFIAWMNCVGKGWSDLTPAEHAEAARLGFCRRLPERREYTIKQLWGYGAG